jgi:NAD(P)-dependent dehydrogenase (short-subunit alcohol dehydrogenase family)
MIRGKVVVVTGAGGGIGRGIALSMAANGAHVVVNDVGHAPGEALEAAGGTALASTDSVSSPESAQKIIEAALDTWGRIDGVVNNAGIVRDRMFFNMSLEEWKAVLDVHLNGSFYVAKAAATHFKAQNSGAYVHMTSTSGLIGNLGQANYNSAKMGIVGLSKSIALDMAKFNVRSNCIAPWAWTPMTATIPDTPENAPRIAKMKKMEAGKIGPLATYLVGDAAAKVSGQIFGVRANEIYLFSQIRMIRSVHRDGGWSPEEIAEHAMPAFESSFFPNVPSLVLTPWDPI